MFSAAAWKLGTMAKGLVLAVFTTLIQNPSCPPVSTYWGSTAETATFVLREKNPRA